MVVINMMFSDFENDNTLNIQTENDLQKAVVRYLRTTDLLFTCPLSVDLNTDEKRITSYLKGYTAGTPDLLIFNKSGEYNGLALELKNPKGTGNISKNQYEFIENLSAECGYFVLISNDFASIIECITLYIRGLL